MPSRVKPVVRHGYRLEKVTIRQLFESGETHEPSEWTLHDRAGHGYFVEDVTYALKAELPSQLDSNS